MLKFRENLPHRLLKHVRPDESQRKSKQILLKDCVSNSKQKFRILAKLYLNIEFKVIHNDIIKQLHPSLVEISISSKMTSFLQ